MAEIGLEPPDFGGVELGPRIHARRIEGLAIDGPAFHPVIAEIENARSNRVRRVWKGKAAEPRRYSAAVPLLTRDMEEHDLPRSAAPGPIHEPNLRADGVFRKIHNQLESLGGRQLDGPVRYRCVEQSAIAADLHKRRAAWRRRVQR